VTCLRGKNTTANNIPDNLDTELKVSESTENAKDALRKGIKTEKFSQIEVNA